MTKQEREELQERLDALIKDCEHLLLDPHEHHVAPVPVGTTVIYIRDAEMSRFSDFVGFDSRKVKLINFNRPAARLHYILRHKYQIRKDLPGYQVEMIVRNLIAEQADAPPEKRLGEQQIDLLKDVYQHPDRYELATSNYHKYYTYPYICYRYRDGAGYETTNTHLIQGTNVVFVDMAEIAQSQKQLRDDAQVLAYLNSFPHQVELGKSCLLIKEKISLHNK